MVQHRDLPLDLFAAPPTGVVKPHDEALVLARHEIGRVEMALNQLATNRAIEGVAVPERVEQGARGQCRVNALERGFHEGKIRSRAARRQRRGARCLALGRATA
jgi:hypothetical protein